MTWTEMIIINGNSELDTKQVVSKFYEMSFAMPEKGLGDITLLRNNKTDHGFCIRLTWHSEIPENGKSNFGFRLAEYFSEKGQTQHSVWRRETSLHLLNGKMV